MTEIVRGGIGSLPGAMLGGLLLLIRRRTARGDHGGVIDGLIRDRARIAEVGELAGCRDGIVSHRAQELRPARIHSGGALETRPRTPFRQPRLVEPLVPSRLHLS